METGVLFSIGGFYVSNEGTRKDPNYHVWIPGLTHSTCDSAYSDLSLAEARCKWLFKNSKDFNKCGIGDNVCNCKNVNQCGYS